MRSILGQALCLTHKYKTRLEGLAKNKLSRANRLAYFASLSADEEKKYGTVIPAFVLQLFFYCHNK
jgi:hypothetical protein